MTITNADRLPRNAINLNLKINPFKTRYFSSDSYKALLGNFKFDLTSSSIDLRNKVDIKYKQIK